SCHNAPSTSCAASTNPARMIFGFGTEFSHQFDSHASDPRLQLIATKKHETLFNIANPQAPAAKQLNWVTARRSRVIGNDTA
ncbi:MAG: hypothetical protein KDA86_16295, partial [Planctomycetaceae bacterium]|nr:hypothetical protein [Planctomycetaceae bacterium]